MTKEDYEKDLKRRQKEHLDRVRNKKNSSWKPCRHDNCKECLGTGIKRNGGICVHMIYCDCPKCSPKF